jgi:hypothetical protein
MSQYQRLPITNYQLPIVPHFTDRCYICAIVVWAKAFEAKAVPIANYAIYNFQSI